MMVNVKHVAGELYEAYCRSVGGKAYDGKPLPGWDELSKDESKTKQRDGWIDAAIKAVELLRCQS